MITSSCRGQGLFIRFRRVEIDVRCVSESPVEVQRALVSHIVETRAERRDDAPFSLTRFYPCPSGQNGSRSVNKIMNVRGGMEMEYAYVIHSMRREHGGSACDEL
jgi:hypothetical protein